MGLTRWRAARAVSASGLAGAAVAVALTAAASTPSGTPWRLVLLAGVWSVSGALVVALPVQPTMHGVEVPQGAHHARARIGWLLLWSALIFALTALSTAWLEGGHQRGAAWAAWLTDRASALVVPLTLLVLLLVPDGRLPTERWRPLVGVVLGAQGALVCAWALLRGPAAAPDSGLPSEALALDNPVGLLPGAWEGALSSLEPWLLSAPLLLVPAAVVHRMRRGRGDERRRVADALAAALVLVVCILVGRFAWPAAADVLDVAGASLFAVVLTSVVLRRSMGGASRLVADAVVYSVLCTVVALATVATVTLLAAADVEVPLAAVGLLAAFLATCLLPLREPLRRLLVRARQGPGPTEEQLVRSLTEQLLESRQAVVVAREEERAALRRELHDVLGPTLAGLTLQLGGLPRVLRSDPEAAAERVGRLEKAARGALDDVRRLSRGLRPASLDELGLVAALEDLAEQQGLGLVLRAGVLPALPPGVEVAAYRIGSEALSNAARHSGADCVELGLAVEEGALVVRVSDTGRGVRSSTVGVGATSMRSRAVELGGRVTVRDTEGGGTTVEARLPLGSVPT